MQLRQEHIHLRYRNTFLEYGVYRVADNPAHIHDMNIDFLRGDHKRSAVFPNGFFGKLTPESSAISRTIVAIYDGRHADCDNRNAKRVLVYGRAGIADPEPDDARIGYLNRLA